MTTAVVLNPHTTLVKTKNVGDMENTLLKRLNVP